MSKKPLISDNIKTVLKILLKRLGISHSNFWYEKMKEHPDFPSFLSFHHILKQIGIDNVALKVTFDDLSLKLPKPTIVHVATNTDLFLLVDEIDDSNVYVVNASNKREAIDKSLFLKMWKGKVLIVDKDSEVI